MLRLSRSTRSRLLWLLAFALLGAPLARAAAARAQWIDVPYCAASAAPAAAGGHAHRLLVFANAAACSTAPHAAPPPQAAQASRPALAATAPTRRIALAPAAAARRLPPARAPPRTACSFASL